MIRDGVLRDMADGLSVKAKNITQNPIRTAIMTL